MIKFTIPGTPQGKARVRVTRWGAYTPEKTVLYENLIKLIYQNKYKKIFFKNKEPLKMIIYAYFEPVKSTSKKLRQQMLGGLVYPTKKPDGDNIAKAICDALNNVAYADDTQVVDLRVVKEYSEESRVEVRIGVVDIGGVGKIT